MFGRPTGSLAITLAAAIIGAGAAFSLAALVADADSPVRSIAQAMLPAIAGEPVLRIAADPEAEPEVTGTIRLPLRRDD